MAKKEGKTAIATGLVGAAVGVGVGAAAVALSDKKNRKKLTKTMKSAATAVKKQADTSVQSVKKTASRLKQNGNGHMKPAQSTVKRKAS
jgi:gas vesicle protein